MKKYALYVRQDPPSVLASAESHMVGSEFRRYDSYGRFVDGFPEKLVPGDAYIYRTKDGIPEEMPSYFTLDHCTVYEGEYFSVAVLDNVPKPE